MKRSEMLELIQKDIQDILTTSYVVNDLTNKDTMDILLDLFESHGMLPPPTLESMNLDEHGEPMQPIECWDFEWEEE